MLLSDLFEAANKYFVFFQVFYLLASWIGGWRKWEGWRNEECEEIQHRIVRISSLILTSKCNDIFSFNVLHVSWVKEWEGCLCKLLTTSIKDTVYEVEVLHSELIWSDGA